LDVTFVFIFIKFQLRKISFQYASIVNDSRTLPFYSVAAYFSNIVPIFSQISLFFLWNPVSSYILAQNLL
jgi:hypothetical protein